MAQGGGESSILLHRAQSLIFHRPPHLPSALQEGAPAHASGVHLRMLQEGICACLHTIYQMYTSSLYQAQSAHLAPSALSSSAFFFLPTPVYPTPPNPPLHSIPSKKWPSWLRCNGRSAMERFQRCLCDGGDCFAAF